MHGALMIAIHGCGAEEHYRKSLIKLQHVLMHAVQFIDIVIIVNFH